MSVCVHCGVADCEATFHECLVRDFTEPDYGRVHHLTVGAYMLQHNVYTDETAPKMASFLLQYLDAPPDDHTKREVRRQADGQRRVVRRGGSPPVSPDGGWPLTISDVDLESGESYQTTVRAWAESVARVWACDTHD
jgi:hypothetical protein